MLAFGLVIAGGGTNFLELGEDGKTLVPHTLLGKRAHL